MPESTISSEADPRKASPPSISQYYSSYLSRLARAHSVSVRRLAIAEMATLLDCYYPEAVTTSTFGHINHAILEKAIVNLLDMAELHPSVDLIKRLNERETERDTVQREIDQLYQQVKQDSLRVDEELILSGLTEMRNTLSNGELKARKLVLKRVVEKIEVGRDVARLHYKFPMYNLLFKRVRGVVSKVRQDDLMLVEL